MRRKYTVAEVPAAKDAICCELSAGLASEISDEPLAAVKPETFTHKFFLVAEVSLFVMLYATYEALMPRLESR